MNKQVLEAMFANIVANDPARPVMNGVHFESERTYASDGHILVIYHEGSEQLDGKTMSELGEEIEGRYPNVDGVFPKKENWGKEASFDIPQLKKALAYYMKKDTTTANDRVVKNGTCFMSKSLARLLNTMTLVGDPKDIRFYSPERKSATVVTSKEMTCLIMPALYNDEDVDFVDENDIECTKTLSYENLINDFVFNGWKKPEPKTKLAWVA